MQLQYRKLLFLIVIIAITFTSSAQAPDKKTTTAEQIWAGYFNQTRFSKHWGMWAEAQLRTKDDFVTDLSISILRAGLTYYLNDATKLTAGYAYVNAFPDNGHKDISRPEHRPWQQLQWHTKYSKVRTMQWFRVEERFRHKILNDSTLADGYNFNFRARYNFFFQVPLTRRGFAANTMSFIVNDELMVNFGEEIVYNYFDQNRFFLGFAYQTNAQDNIQLGYLNVFQQLAAGNQYKIIHTIRVSYFHNLDLRRK